MTHLHVILDHELPLSQDYSALKEKGLAFIQEHSGHQWTNLNNVDPGITILDQVCYALTELGYCNDFPVADILTAANGRIAVKDQFYLPEEILTTSPVTIADYRKCLIDGVKGVSNAVILPIQPSQNGGYGAYQVYLQPDASMRTAQAMDDLCKVAFLYLNKWRNLGELFLMPLCLISDIHTISGQIEIIDETELSQVLVRLQLQVQQYIFPQVQVVGYDTLSASGIRAEDIFNGPLLQDGWISSSDLGEKKDQLLLIELQQLIRQVEGIISVSGLHFNLQAFSLDLNTPQEEVHTTADKLLVIDWAASLSAGLTITCKGRKLYTDPNLRALSGSGPQPSDPDMVFGTAPNIRSTIPRGKFRDINSYYSIQNTFPEIFAVGADATVSNATDFQIAQSRQLKGYLTLFDQVLANQFSQLANVGTLFSFKNALSGTPSDREQFYALKDDYPQLGSEYPVPYLTFSPTYFYQSLYTVPHIRPLLKGNEVFNFGLEAGSQQQLDEKSWNDYKTDPYNAYIKGLMYIIEEEQTSISRRNAILDHLLARHGESPLLIDTLLNGSSYAGENLKDQVIFKSLYLQHLGLLSYFRLKAYNYLGAKKLSDRLPDVTLNFDRQIMSGYTNDFIFDSGKVDEIEELNAADFINYSAVELKLSLLFGLRVQYRNFIANYYGQQEMATNLKLAMWMILQRRGLLLIETGLLLAQQAMPAEVMSTHAMPDLAMPGTATSGTVAQVILIFPAFLLHANTEETFRSRINVFLQEAMPVQLSYSYHFVSSSMLERLIVAFVDWHNGQIYPSAIKEDKQLVSSAESLLHLIYQINTTDHE